MDKGFLFLNFSPGKSISIALSLLCLLIVVRCAKQVRPSGGPEDKTPPKIVKTIPEHNSTFVPLDQEIEIHFNESMNKKSLEKAIFMTPDPGEDVKYNWKGDRLVIEFKKKLGEDRTYVITLGTDLKDSHGNGLSNSFTLAFSTGEKISNGKISGKVFSEKPKGNLIWAYILDSANAPNPVKDQPNYITQSDNSGAYELSHLSKGNYRVFAIQDTDNNRFFETGLDGIGVPQKDVQLISDSVTVEAINFKIHISDTLGPAISSVFSENKTNLSISFDEAISHESATNKNNYAIKPSQEKSNETLDIHFVYQNAIDQNQVHLVTAEQKEGVEYIVEVDSLYDLAGNIVDPEFNYDYFTGAAQPDTFRPKIVKHFPKKNANAVALDIAIEFFFSEAMDTSSFSQNFSILQDSVEAIQGMIVWPGLNKVNFLPTTLLASAKRYLVEIPLDSVFDIAGNALETDSTFTMSFRTLNVDTFSSISGMIIDSDSAAIGSIFLTAYRDKDKSNSYEIKLEQPGKYEFKSILPGSYQIEGFRDRDNNGQYSWGTAYPFEPSERFFVYSDSIKVRARWPNEGNDIVIPK